MTKRYTNLRYFTLLSVTITARLWTELACFCVNVLAVRGRSQKGTSRGMIQHPRPSAPTRSTGNDGGEARRRHGPECLGDESFSFGSVASIQLRLALAAKCSPIGCTISLNQAPIQTLSYTSSFRRLLKTLLSCESCRV